MEKNFNKNKIKNIKSPILKSALEKIHENFCDQCYLAKEFSEQLASDEKSLNDKDFEKKYKKTKSAYSRSKESCVVLFIQTNWLGALVAKLLGLTKEQIISSGYTYTSLGFEVAKLYIKDPDFLIGKYSRKNDWIEFRNINFSAKEIKKSITLCMGDDFQIISAT